MDMMARQLQSALERIRELEEKQERTESQMQSVFSHIGQLYSSQSIESTVEILGSLGKEAFEAEKCVFLCCDKIEGNVFTVEDGKQIHYNLSDILSEAIEKVKPIIRNDTAYLPIKSANNEVMGVLVAQKGNFDDRNIKKFDTDGEIGSVFKLGLEKERQHQFGITDKLTKLKNRKGMEEYTESDLLKSINTEKPVTVVMCDIDKFKGVNDTYGHDAGDIVLQHVAKILKDNVRAGVDGAFRYGGEEFVIVLNGIEKDNAFDIAERIRKTVENFPCDIGNDKTISVTVSMGLQQVTAEQANEYNVHNIVGEAKSKADALLYVAKKEGRNRVVADDGNMTFTAPPPQDGQPLTVEDLVEYQSEALEKIINAQQESDPQWLNGDGER